jgi:hypothetical protein
MGVLEALGAAHDAHKGSGPLCRGPGCGDESTQESQRCKSVLFHRDSIGVADDVGEGVVFLAEKQRG